MSYDVANLLHDARQRLGGVGAIVATIGRSESTVDSQHAAAVAFWEAALALAGDDALSVDERAIAEREVARHSAALAPPALGPRHMGAV